MTLFWRMTEVIIKRRDPFGLRWRGRHTDQESSEEVGIAVWARPEEAQTALYRWYI